MSNTAPNLRPTRWVFNNYIVFANDHYAARRIYESIEDRRDGRVMFGSITLDDETNGFWVMIKDRRETAAQESEVA